MRRAQRARAPRSPALSASLRHCVASLAAAYQSTPRFFSSLFLDLHLKSGAAGDFCGEFGGIGLVAALLVAFPTGDHQAKLVAEFQPVTLAAMEGRFESGDAAALTFVSGLLPRAVSGGVVADGARHRHRTAWALG